MADAAQIKATDYQALSLSRPITITETLYVYNETGQLIGDYNTTGNPKQEIIYLGNIPIAVMKNNNLYYIHSDQLGTPRAITDVNNTTRWSWKSDPFGKITANEDPDGDNVSFEFNLRFAGQYYDSETGLHYNYFRDYDPSTGRYVQSDPIGLGGGLNTYGYVYQNPLYWIDPYGLRNARTRTGGRNDPTAHNSVARRGPTMRNDYVHRNHSKQNSQSPLRSQPETQLRQGRENLREQFTRQEDFKRELENMESSFDKLFPDVYKYDELFGGICRK